ncbi:leucine-rich repeat domain-containing protein, partial [Shewanella sp. SG41-4]|uniref:leucine-rich repeat domain-containing protein n=1 Tax=Shewanella sp. SG41-4 TaxID=2760976 RepID=UPI0016033E12
MIDICGGYSCSKLSNVIKDQDGQYVLIISICSDDLLPLEPNEIINRILCSSCSEIHIHILGDLVGIPTEQWRVRGYLLDELSFLAINLKLKFFWYDGDKIREGINLFCMVPLLVDDLKYSPRIEMEKVDNVIYEGMSVLSLVNKSGYPYNFLRAKTKKERDYFFSAISEVETLKVLECPFLSDFKVDNLPKNLEVLDLRGCKDFELRTANEFVSLKSVNFGACLLYNLPDLLFGCSNLERLYLYKNFLKGNEIKNLPLNIKTLSLYRNKIEDVDVRLDFLERLNLGANPLRKISIHHEQDSVKLELRKVDF